MGCTGRDTPRAPHHRLGNGKRGSSPHPSPLHCHPGRQVTERQTVLSLLWRPRSPGRGRRASAHPTPGTNSLSPPASAASRTQDGANSPGKRCGTGREDGGEQVRVHVRTRASAPRPTPTPTPRPALTAQVAGRALAEPWLCSVHTANTGLGPPRGGSLQHAPTHHHKLGPQKNAHLRLFVPGASG